jgi:hypothetical protein
MVPINRPRDLAGAFELKEGTGPILALCPAGDLLEVYKVDRCFEVLSPDNVDPKQIDPNAPWIVKHVSAFGAGNEIVARTVLQADSITRHVSFKEDVDTKGVMAGARTCRDNLLECKRLSAKINDDIDRLVNEHKVLELKGNVIASFPKYEGLREVAGAFLLCAKQCLQGAVTIINSFFAQSFSGPRFHKIRDWCAAALPESGLSKFLADNEPRAKWIIDLRNFYEHPGDKVTEIRDFYWEAEKRSTHLPSWNITGDPETSIAKDSGAILDFLLDFVEAIIVLCAIECTCHFPYMIVRIEQAKPEMPVRYSIEIDPRILQ